MFEATLRKNFSRALQIFGVFSSDFIFIRFILVFFGFFLAYPPHVLDSQ